MPNTITAYTAAAPKSPFARTEITLPPLAAEDVEVKVETCGVCHSDLSMLNNDWGMTTYPAIFGHEAIGTITALGSAAKGLKLGQRVGVGWTASSCMHCRQCMGGSHHLCPQALPTIAGHYGAFASHVRAHWAWTLPIPESTNPNFHKDIGPLLCGGITVFNPISTHASPTSRIGVIGIGGLGHMALKFAKAFGSHVTAFTSSESKYEEAKQLGAHQSVSTRNPDSIKAIAGSLDLLVSTVNVPLDWDLMISTLAPNGRLHILGAVPDAIPFHVIPLIFKQGSIGASPTGSPTHIATMLDFAARNNITPTTEHFPMSQINQAFHHLESGKARYRIVLDADF